MIVGAPAAAAGPADTGGDTEALLAQGGATRAAALAPLAAAVSPAVDTAALTLPVPSGALSRSLPVITTQDLLSGRPTIDPGCLAQISKSTTAVPRDVCAVYEFDVARIVTPSDPKLPSTYITGDAATASAPVAAAKFATRSKEWRSCTGNFYWQTCHDGVTYYNGEKVWGNISYQGFKGNHYCDTWGYGIGYSVSATNCIHATGPYATKAVYKYQFKVSLIFNGFPVAFSHELTKTLWVDGLES